MNLLFLGILCSVEITNGQTLKEPQALPEPTMVGLVKDSIAVYIFGSTLLWLVENYDGNKHSELVNQIRLRTISQLRKAGIKISNDKFFSRLKFPRLEVSALLQPLLIDKTIYAYTFSVRVGLSQKVRLSRDRNIEDYATTWQKIEFGYASQEEIYTTLKRSIKEKTNEFIIEFLKANTK